MKEKGNYQIIVNVTAKDASDALGRWKKGKVVAVFQTLPKDLTDAIGTTFDPPEWSDDEETPDEVGFAQNPRSRRRSKP